jgi:hypothetical protein
MTVDVFQGERQLPLGARNFQRIDDVEHGRWRHRAMLPFGSCRTRPI